MDYHWAKRGQELDSRWTTAGQERVWYGMGGHVRGLEWVWTSVLQFGNGRTWYGSKIHPLAGGRPTSCPRLPSSVTSHRPSPELATLFSSLWPSQKPQPRSSSERELKAVNLYDLEHRISNRLKEEMNKLLEYGRKAWFIIRIMSGYEERRIRAYRLQLQEKIQRAQAKKEEVKKLPEQVILSEIRRMVEEMQGLNRVLEETEAKIEEHFKPIDELAHRVMNMQMEKEERQMKNLMKIMQDQALMQREAAMRSIEASNQKEVNESGVDLENPAQQAQEQKKVNQ